MLATQLLIAAASCGVILTIINRRLPEDALTVRQPRGGNCHPHENQAIERAHIGKAD